MLHPASKARGARRRKRILLTIAGRRFRFRVQMIEALILIFQPGAAWDRLVLKRRGFLFILGAYLLPMILISSVVEGWGLRHWGKWQPSYEKLKEFSLGTVITFEVIQTLLLLAMVLLSALLLLKVSQTFHGRHSYLQAFMTMAYGFSPLFLMRLFDAGPMVHPAITWGIGILLVIWILYQGIPRVMQPDPTHAFGLYLSVMFLVVLISGIARMPTALYLLGLVDFHHSWLTQKFPGLFQ